jgi:hypothetical protein
MEVQEVLYPICSAEDRVPHDSALWKFSQYAVEAAAKIGIDMTIAPRFKELLMDQGFVNIRSEPIKWAVCTWPKGKREKNIGWWTRENTRQFIKSFLVDVRKDVEDSKEHFY